MPTPTHTHPRARPRARRLLAVLARNLRTIPHQLTLLRLLMGPGLWGLGVMGQPVWGGVGGAAAATTDMLDGYLSRKWNQTSVFGSRMDSVADHLLAISTTPCVALLRPHFFHEQ